MTKPARYAITYGMAGCYLPDTHEGAIQCDTRADLIATIKDRLEHYEMPASLLREVGVQRLWRYIQRHGSSVAHFTLTHKGFALSFHGLTLAEYRETETEH